MDLMFPLVAGFGNSRSSLDVVSNLNSSRSDWVLVYATRKLSVLKQKDMHKVWTFNAGPIHRFEASRGTNTPNKLELRCWLSSQPWKCINCEKKNVS